VRAVFDICKKRIISQLPKITLQWEWFGDDEMIYFGWTYFGVYWKDTTMQIFYIFSILRYISSWVPIFRKRAVLGSTIRNSILRSSSTEIILYLSRGGSRGWLRSEAWCGFSIKSSNISLVSTFSSFDKDWNILL